jgi:WD40 repeat protein
MGRTKHKLVGHKDGVMCLALIKENLLISAARDHTLKVWDITTYECIKSLQDEERIKAITILLDGNIATSSNAHIKIRNVKEDLNCIKIIKFQGYDYYSKLFVLDNDKSACLCYWDFEVCLLILDMNKGFDCLQKMSEEGLCIDDSFVHLNNDKFAYIIDSQKIKIRNVLDYEHLKNLEGHTCWVNTLLFVKKYNIMLSGSFDTIRAWCTISYQCIRIIELTTGIKSLLLLPNGFFASGCPSKGGIKIWNIYNYECINSFESQSGMITSLLLTEDKRIISASPDDNTIVISDK